MLPEPDDRHIRLLALSVSIVTVQFTGSCSSENEALFIYSFISQAQGTLFIFSCTGGTKNLFSYSLNNGSTAFYVFPKETGAVPVSFISNEES